MIKTIRAIEKNLLKFMENYFGKFVDLYSSIQFIHCCVRYECVLHSHTHPSQYFSHRNLLSPFIYHSVKVHSGRFVCDRTRLHMFVVDYIQIHCRGITSMQSRTSAPSNRCSIHFHNYCNRFQLNCTMRSYICVCVYAARSSSHSHKWLQTILGSSTS